MSGTDPGFPVGGGASPPGEGRQHTNLPDFPKNCMKLRNFWSVGGGRAPGCPPLDPPLHVPHDVLHHTVQPPPQPQPRLSLQTWDMGTPYTYLSPDPSPLLLTSGGHHWRPVQACSFDLTVQPPAPTTTDIWWPPMNIQLTSGQYVSYWNAFLFILRHLVCYFPIKSLLYV